MCTESHHSMSRNIAALCPRCFSRNDHNVQMNGRLDNTDRIIMNSVNSARIGFFVSIADFILYVVLKLRKHSLCLGKSSDANDLEIYFQYPRILSTPQHPVMFGSYVGTEVKSSQRRIY